MTTLRLVPPTGLHDLPPKWDGRTVTWEGWQSDPIRICPPPKPEPCKSCGSTEPSHTNTGMVHPLPHDTFTVPIVKHTRSGREYVAGRGSRHDEWPLAQLVAFRCPSCHADHVLDRGRDGDRADSWWDLDASDYGDEGSR